MQFCSIVSSNSARVQSMGSPKACSARKFLDRKSSKSRIFSADSRCSGSRLNKFLTWL